MLLDMSTGCNASRCQPCYLSHIYYGMQIGIPIDTLESDVLLNF